MIIDLSELVKSQVKLQDPVPPPPTAETASIPDPFEVGAKMEDGTAYAGISPDTHQPMFALLTNAGRVMQYSSAQQFAENAADTTGQKGFRLPSAAESEVLRQNAGQGALKGKFNLSGSYPEGIYWTGTRISSDRAMSQSFRDGHLTREYVFSNASVMVVR